MSTLGVNHAALQAAVASYPIVRAIHTVPSFPHGLRIEVTEQPPVAALTIGGQRTAVAADGVVLGPGLITGSLPALSDPQAPAPAVGGHVQGQSLLAELTILGAEPRSLMRFDARVFNGSKDEGLTVAMYDGLLVYFGDATRPHAKWLSLARVLADSSSAGATYIDVRVPERPAAGFASASALAESTGSSGAAGASGSTGAATSTPEATVAELAEKLTESTTGEPAAATTAPVAGTTSATAGSSETEASPEAAAASDGAGAGEAESASGSGESASSGESESASGAPSEGG
jgi:cell division protein FtsQ